MTSEVRSLSFLGRRSRWNRHSKSFDRVRVRARVRVRCNANLAQSLDMSHSDSPPNNNAPTNSKCISAFPHSYSPTPTPTPTPTPSLYSHHLPQSHRVRTRAYNSASHRFEEHCSVNQAGVGHGTTRHDRFRVSRSQVQLPKASPSFNYHARGQGVSHFGKANERVLT